MLDSRYRIDAVIGSGGMGRVYRAEHTALGRTVAIKVLHHDLGRNKEAVTRFQREALASGRLDHTNIVGVTDFGVLDDGACFLVMEALEGEPLGARLDRDKTIPWPEALAILRGVLAGLRHAHDRGVVHRDIKPDNIFLALKDGEAVVKILDFGIAKLYAGSADDPATTRAGLTVGTPAYLSPEQAVGGEISPASDLYSTTVVLFEMLTGRPPFDGKDPLAMLTSHVSKQPPRLADIATFELPPGLDELVSHGLAKMPADRIASAVDYLLVVEEILGIQRVPSQPVIAAPSQPVIAVPEPAPPALPFAETHEHPVTPAPRSATPMPLPVHAVTPIPADPSTPVPAHPLLAPITIATQTVAPRASQTDHDRTTTYVPSPSPRRATVFPDAPDALPRKWLYVSVAVLVIAAITAIAFAITSHAHEPTTVPPTTDEPKATPKPPDPPPSKPKAHADEPPPQPEPKQVTVATPPPPPPSEPEPVASAPSPEQEAKFQTAMTVFSKGKGCRDRKAGFEILVTLDDPRVLPAIKKLGHRYHDKYMGLSHDDYNACFGADVDAFLKGK